MSASNDKTKIFNELKKVSPDLQLVQELIIELQDKQDTDLIRFRVNGSLINRLGAELVEKKETAICELIKNSYDADSKVVTADFISRGAKSKIIVLDKGNGMTRDDIVKGFMVIGTQNKLDNPYSPVLKRKRAGSKGIGRIAAFRLGKTLTIETRAKNSPGYRVKIDWTEFEDSNEITSIRFPIEEVSNLSYGTTLTIENLNDAWDYQSVEVVYKYVEDLLQPEVVSKEIKINTDSFDVKFNLVDDDGVVIPIKKKGKLIFDYAHADIDAWVTSRGIHEIRLKSKPFDVKETAYRGDSDFSKLAGVHFKAHYFIHGKAGLVGGLNKKKINQLLEDGRFGIRVYRNGFRVLPFGEKDNDWLGLDFHEAKRKILVPVGNKNFFGFISIFDPQDDRFVETSNREGFVHNDAFDELTKFALETCLFAVQKIGELRGKKIFATQKDFKAGAGGSPKAKLAEIENQLTNILTNEVAKNQNIAKNEEAMEEVQDKIREHVKSAMINIRQQYVEPNEEYSSSLLEENSMLRILATLGISVAEFTHEMRLFVPALENDVDSLETLVKEFAAKKILARMRENIGSLSNYLGFFDNTIIQNTDRTIEPQDLPEIVNEFHERMNSDWTKAGIAFVLESRIRNAQTIPMHYSEWISILFNLYTNAKKAIRGIEKEGRILVRLSREGKNISLEFQDNGLAIPVKIRDQIFDAFVTSTKLSDLRKKRSGDVSGSGLGLWIVRQILSHYGGEISLTDPAKGYTKSFKILIPFK